LSSSTTIATSDGGLRVVPRFPYRCYTDQRERKKRHPSEALTTYVVVLNHRCQPWRRTVCLSRLRREKEQRRGRRFVVAGG
jgi:hypothetical protein